jgi:hypothetical protein
MIDTPTGMSYIKIIRYVKISAKAVEEVLTYFIHFMTNLVKIRLERCPQKFIELT